MLSLFRLAVYRMYLYQYNLHPCIRRPGQNGAGHPGDEHEDRFYNRTVLAWFHLFDLRAQRVLSLYSHASAYGAAAQFFGALFVARFYVVIFLLQIVPAVLLLADRYVPLALTILGAVIFNILCFHIFMAPAGLPLAVVVTVLWFLTIWTVRSAFTGIHQR
jgi:hypothetical protein